MKTSSNPSAHIRGFTLLELLFVVLIISILALLILPVLGKAQARAKRAECVNHLRQIGIANHEFAHDHQDQFPFQVATNDGGTLEFARAGFAMIGEFYFAFRHFQALSNTLGTPRLLRCPTDTRTNADHFGILRNLNISYFVGVNAEYSKPGSILAGDRNITSDSYASGSILRLNPNAPAQWTSGCHEFRGNLLFADAHVEQSNNEGLASAIHSAGSQPGNLLPPITPPGGGDGSIVAQPTVVATLQRFFDTAPATQGSSAANPDANPNATPTPAVPANPPATRPADVPTPAAAAPGMAAPRPASKADANIATNPAPAVAARDAAGKAGEAGAPGAVPSGTPGAGASPGYEFNFYFLLFQPGRHFWSWLLLLLLAVVAAFCLGWRLQRSRARKRLAAASPTSPAA
ncbi:MAG TPA: prepilin-type N-terminal cleavage/methylation domain-containing protein [Verrucomicrobiae bacterium]|nr:prepilin-type N-terminal cleavage/methylation domain-containing protein [Verrucomicrobiae bacterium]